MLSFFNKFSMYKYTHTVQNFFYTLEDYFMNMASVWLTKTLSSDYFHPIVAFIGKTCMYFPHYRCFLSSERVFFLHCHYFSRSTYVSSLLLLSGIYLCIFTWINWFPWSTSVFLLHHNCFPTSSYTIIASLDLQMYFYLVFVAFWALGPLDVIICHGADDQAEDKADSSNKDLHSANNKKFLNVFPRLCMNF